MKERKRLIQFSIAFIAIAIIVYILAISLFADVSLPQVKEDSEDISVYVVQFLLNEQGYNISVDGKFGPKTSEAVKSFQVENGLTIDGIVGENTWNELCITLKINSTHLNAVKALQYLLVEKHGYTLSIDGIFGPKTLNAVEDFQSRSEIAVDGIVGPTTWKYLLAGKVAETGLEISTTLKKGSKGNEVNELQKKLQILGLYIGSINPDGEFCDYTEAAVKSVQDYSNITIDGIVGMKETVPAINNLVNNNSTIKKVKLLEIQNKYISPTIEYGIVNPYVVYTYDEMLKDICELKNKYADLIKVKSIGKSYESRDIPIIKLGKGSKKITLNGSHHAREYISTTFLMEMIEVYAESYNKNEIIDGYDVKKLLDEVTLYIVPMVNPDGVTIVQYGLEKTKFPLIVEKLNGEDNNFDSWKANARGVDLNRQYPYKWDSFIGPDSPAPEGFKGDKPLSEKETQALYKLTSENNFLMHVAYHTQGEIIFWYTNQTGNFFDKCYSITSRLSSLTGYSLLSKSSQSNSCAGYKDWTISKFKKPGFTIELCPYIGSKPYPDYKFNDVLNKVKSTGLFFANEALKY